MPRAALKDFVKELQEYAAAVRAAFRNAKKRPAPQDLLPVYYRFFQRDFPDTARTFEGLTGFTPPK